MARNPTAYPECLEMNVWIICIDIMCIEKGWERTVSISNTISSVNLLSHWVSSSITHLSHEHSNLDFLNVKFNSEVSNDRQNTDCNMKQIIREEIIGNLFCVISLSGLFKKNFQIYHLILLSWASWILLMSHARAFGHLPRDDTETRKE